MGETEKENKTMKHKLLSFLFSFLIAVSGFAADGTDIRGVATLGDGGSTNYVEVDTVGDMKFVGGAGLVYGGISVKDNANAITLNSAAIVQITDFDTNDPSNNTTPDHTNDHITISIAGDYLVTVSIHINNNAAQSHVVDISLYKNNGATEFDNVHAHRNLTGGLGDVGSMSMAGIITVSVNDTLEVWATTGDAGDRSVTISDITVSVIQIGG